MFSLDITRCKIDSDTSLSQAYDDNIAGNIEILSEERELFLQHSVIFK